jgi:hypothetical protein
VQPRRRGPLVAAVVAGAVAVIVAVVLVVALTGGGASGPATDSAAPRLALPDQVAGYTHAVDADAGRVVDTFRTSISKANGADLSAEKAQLAVYRTPQAAAALFVLADTARDDAVLHRTLSSGRPAALALRLLSENQIDVSRTFPPGPGGGSLQCANGTVQPGVTTPVCVWASAHTFGELIDLTGKLDPGRLAAVTRTVRAAAERG